MPGFTQVTRIFDTALNEGIAADTFDGGVVGGDEGECGVVIRKKKERERTVVVRRQVRFGAWAWQQVARDECGSRSSPLWAAALP